MRFGISATSWIFPKNLRTRLRPVNVCAISFSLLSYRRGRDDSPESRNPSRPSGQPSNRRLFLCDSAAAEPFEPVPPVGGYSGDSEDFLEITDLCPPGPVPAVLVARRLYPRVALRLPGDFAQMTCGHLSSTFAPTFSRMALIFSASSFGIS